MKKKKNIYVLNVSKVNFQQMFIFLWTIPLISNQKLSEIMQ